MADASLTENFARAARILARAAREEGLVVPSFRSPPRALGEERTLRRRGDQAIVSVRVRARPWAVVLADMVDGVVAANDLTGTERGASLARTLWALLDEEFE